MIDTNDKEFSYEIQKQIKYKIQFESIITIHLGHIFF